MTAERHKGRKPDFVSRIVGYRRLNNSVNGNPRFDVQFYGENYSGVHTTQSDSSVSYDIENYGRGTYDSPGPLLAVWLSRAGRIEVVTKLKEES